MYEDFFNRPLEEVDRLISSLIQYEEERQARKIILIPSESMAPAPVRQALSSVFNNLYAEGYPPVRMVRADEELLRDFAYQLSYLRRYADRRFYKGVEYVDILESLTQRRVAQCFSNPNAPAEEIFVNIQPLSGAAANLAVYDAFVEPGDVVMGMDLMHGGHLTHGSRFNFSGKRYNVVSYTVDPKTERLDYDQIMELAKEHRPKLLIAGYTSYPWAPDWKRFREIADAVGAILLADIAHTAGMVIGGVYPNPVGIADVVTFTTHKTILGPRGACILTTDEGKAQQIDSAVFPGEQGGPHTNKFAAMAVAFGIAQTEAFREVQQRIVDNAKYLAEALKDKGIRLAYGGTDTHIVMVDLKSLHPELKGEPAARILDLAGIVVNRNTIPGDTRTALATGIRLGTPWVSQQGMGQAEMERIAGLIHRILSNIKPFSYRGLRGELPRGKIELDLLEEVKQEVE
ncbi:MAG: serine hydroxymethyltransferase, partial [Candidatus Bipolaricaulia bacterium]